MYPASIQLSNDSFHQKHIGKKNIDFNANTIAVAGSRRACGDPVMTRSPRGMLHTQRSTTILRLFLYLRFTEGISHETELH